MLLKLLRFSGQLNARTVHCSKALSAVKPSQSTGKKRFRRPVTEDAERIVNYVCGSNIFKEGEDIKIKDDSEYPDWIWEMNLGKPLPLSSMDKNTKEYWERFAIETRIRRFRLMKSRPKTVMAVGENAKKQIEWMERLKYRIIAAQEYDAGWNPTDLRDEVDKRYYLRPQPSDEPLYLDEYELPPTFKF
ncbi:39S ribosomal protein L54-like protein [Leptotrombidium deliense]|uniref:Large ribosomal subunit protein mL54 n=1 Tax=Leptotrombidium deliense TaxID=299467 RepID=A0A443SS73_9ACAR|nr:39S ribosomal protein L54-like protein [Leptotrombidium deliense]